MIFVTVGTHEQPFDRLIKAIDHFKISTNTDESIIIQTGYSTYEPVNCTWRKFFSYQDMVKNITEAEIIITHGAPSSFIMPLQIGKIPIVIPRQKSFGEHVNDHQLEFCRTVESKLNNIILVENILNLEDTIINYPEKCKGKRSDLDTNNKNFNRELNRLVEELI